MHAFSLSYLSLCHFYILFLSRRFSFLFSVSNFLYRLHIIAIPRYESAAPYIFLFVSHRFHFVCLLVCFVKFSVSLRLFVSLSFSYFCRIELFIETQPRPFSFLAESIFFRFSLFLFAFYKNVHLLRLNSRQLFNFFFFSFKDTTTYYTYMALQMFACTATQMCVMKVSWSVSGDADRHIDRSGFLRSRRFRPIRSPFRVSLCPLAYLGRVFVSSPSFSVPDGKDGLYTSIDSIDLLATNGP